MMMIFEGPWPAAALLVCLVGLCTLIAVIDWRHRIIPDLCNVAVGVLGLLAAGINGFAAMAWAAVQGMAVFALFWCVRRLYRAIRPVHGLGLGDVKFLGAAGIWIGLDGVAPLLLVSCTTALAWIMVDHWRGRPVSSRYALPFGPFLALGLVVITGWPSG